MFGIGIYMTSVWSTTFFTSVLSLKKLFSSTGSVNDIDTKRKLFK